MQPPHLARTDVASHITLSPNNQDTRPFTPVLRNLVAELVPVPQQEALILAALEALDMIHEAYFRSPPPPLNGVARTWSELLVEWLVSNNHITPPKVAIYTNFCNALVARCNALTTGNNSRKRHIDEISESSSMSTTSPAANVCNGKRFPGIDKLNTAHDKFWEYLLIAAKLSVAKNRAPSYTCVCGSEESATQAYNFGRHLNKCAPGLYPPKNATDWKPPLLPLHPISASTRAAFAKLSNAELVQIPARWRELIGPAPTPHAALHSDLSQSSPSPPPPLVRQSTPPAAALAPPVVTTEELAEQTIAGHFDPSSLIAAMDAAAAAAQPLDFCLDPKVLHGA